MEVMSGLDDKSSRVLRANVLLMGLFTSLATVLLRTDTPDPAVFPTAMGLYLAGTGGLGVSTFFAVLSYLRKDVSAGVTRLSGHLDGPVEETDYLERSIEAHERAGDRNLRLVDRAAYWFQNALGALAASVGTVLAASLGVALGPVVGIAAAVVSAVGGAIVTLKGREDRDV